MPIIPAPKPPDHYPLIDSSLADVVQAVAEMHAARKELTAAAQDALKFLDSLAKYEEGDTRRPDRNEMARVMARLRDALEQLEAAGRAGRPSMRSE